MDMARQLHDTARKARPTMNNDWHERASCREFTYMADAWFPDQSDYESKQAARRVCAVCEVRRECLRAGLYEEHGIWGGWTITERRRLIESLPKNGTARLLRLHHAADIGPTATRLNDTEEKQCSPASPSQAI